MAVRQSNRGKVLADFADNVVRLAKINIGKTYTATNSRGKRYKKRIDFSGKLRNSIKGEVKQRNDEDGRFQKAFVVFKMLEYGLTVDKGRKRGKGISEQGQIKLQQWIRKKPLRIRDLESGKFLKITDSRVKGLAYLISKNTKEFGIKPTNFFTDAYESQLSKFYNQMQEAIADDNIDDVVTKLETISNAD